DDTTTTSGPTTATAPPPAPAAAPEPWHPNPNAPYGHPPPDLTNLTVDQQFKAMQSWMNEPGNAPAESDVQAQQVLAYKQLGYVTDKSVLSSGHGDELRDQAQKAEQSGDTQKAADLR